MRPVYLSLAVAFNVASYLLYKSIAHKQGTILWFVLFALGLILGGVNVLFFTKALQGIKLSIAYPVRRLIFSAARMGCGRGHLPNRLSLLCVCTLFAFAER